MKIMAANNNSKDYILLGYYPRNNHVSLFWYSARPSERFSLRHITFLPYESHQQFIHVDSDLKYSKNVVFFGAMEIIPKNVSLYLNNNNNYGNIRREVVRENPGIAFRPNMFINELNKKAYDHLESRFKIQSDKSPGEIVGLVLAHIADESNISSESILEEYNELIDYNYI